MSLSDLLGARIVGVFDTRGQSHHDDGLRFLLERPDGSRMFLDVVGSEWTCVSLDGKHVPCGDGLNVGEPVPRPRP